MSSKSKFKAETTPQMKILCKLLAQGKLLNPKILLLVVTIAFLGHYAPDRVGDFVKIIMTDQV